MRLVYVNHTAAVGGAEHSLLGMMEIAAHHHSVSLICPSGELSTLASERGFDVATIPTPTFGTLRSVRSSFAAIAGLLTTIWTVRQRVINANADLVHANSPRAALLTLARPRGTQLITHFRDLLYSRAFKAIMLPVARLTSGRCLAISYAVAEGARGRRSRDSFTVLHNFVNDPRSRPAPAQQDGDPWALRAELGTQSDSCVVCYAAQLTPWKNQSAAIMALRTFSAAARPSLLIVGGVVGVSTASLREDESYAHKLRHLTREHELEEWVHFLGHRSDVSEIMDQSDVIALLSTSEPFGRVLIEAMALGRVVVATAHGGPAEIVSDGFDGLLVDSLDADKVAAKLRVAVELSDSDRERMGLHARATYESRFSPAVFETRLMQLYEEVGGTDAAG